MTLATNAFHSFQATGNREDLTDILSMIDPVETPIYNMMGASNPIRGTYHEWQTDNLAAANADNTVVEGNVYSPGALTPTMRYGNYVVTSEKTGRVTDIQDIVNKGGRGSEMSYQKSKKLKELKRDMEAMLVFHGTAASAGAGSTTVPRRMSNVWFWTVNTTAHTGVSGIAAGTNIATNLTGATITETQFNDIVQNIWADGGRPNSVYVNGTLKRLVSGWGTSTSRVWDGSRTIVNVVDVYEGDFATLQIHKERHIASSLGLILQDDMWKKGFLEPPREKPIGPTAAAKDFFYQASWTIEARNPTASGLFTSAP